MKKVFFTVVLASATLFFSGCASITGNSLKSIGANTDWVRPNLTADLDVSPNKIVGVATGREKQTSGIGKAAMLDALIKYNSGRLDKDIADLLVEPTYFYEYDGFGNVIITVVGYPARYKNFRSYEKPQTPLIDTIETSNSNGNFNELIEKGRKRMIVGSVLVLPFCWAGFPYVLVASGSRLIKKGSGN